MPRPKGSKNKPKTAEKATVVSTVDYTELIEEKLNEKTQISAEITSITDQLEALKAQSVAARTYSLGKAPVRIHAPAVIKQRYEHG